MSTCCRATVAAISRVIAPTTATMSPASHERSKNAWQRTIRYTPAVTMVAAWIRALTGVGPSMASGSHVCSGTWALLAAAPTNSSRQMASTVPEFAPSPDAPANASP